MIFVDFASDISLSFRFFSTCYSSPQMQLERSLSLCQDGFDGLTILDLQQDGGCIYRSDDHGMLSGCSGSRKSRDSADYVPQNFISQEVYQLFATFERMSVAQREDSAHDEDAMEISTYEADIEHEPTRPLTPPKKFSRTFWRSATRRLLQQEKRDVLNEIRRSLTAFSSYMVP